MQSVQLSRMTMHLSGAIQPYTLCSDSRKSARSTLRVHNMSATIWQHCPQFVHHVAVSNAVDLALSTDLHCTPVHTGMQAASNGHRKLLIDA